MPPEKPRSSDRGVVTFYDSVLLLCARWRWFLALPAFSVLSAVLWLVLTMPPGVVARSVVRSDPSLPSARAVALLTSRTLAERIHAPALTVEVRKGDVIEVRARADTKEEAVRIVTEAIAAVNDDEARRHLSELRRLLAEQAALRQRTDRYAVIEYAALMPRLESLRNGPPKGDALEVLEPIVAAQPTMLRPYPLVVAGLSALVVVFFAVFVQAWWVAEQAAAEARR